MKIKYINWVLIFLLGGFAYGGIEIIYRGYTHPTMMLAGGLSLISLAYLSNLEHIPFLLRCLLGGGIITSIEFLLGVIFNLLLGLNIWDYSGVPFNILGQICLSFSFAWIFLSGIGMVITKKILRLLPNGQQPKIKQKHIN